MMIPRKLYYILHSGKNSKLRYYLTSYLWILTPHCLLSLFRKMVLSKVSQRNDWEEISQRVDYYNKLQRSTIDHSAFQQQAICLAKQKKTGQSVYYLDSFRYAKAFPLNNKWKLLPGDITAIPEVPSIVKSRPIDANNANAVLMKLDRVRHFLFVNDPLRFTEKANKVVFRGLIGQFDSNTLKQNRYDFVKKFFGNPRFNIGVIDKHLTEWYTEKMTIREHLDYMEGTLIPNYHYIEVKPDYSDLEDRIDYYISHPDEAQAIINHAHEHVNRFRNARRECIISLLVLDKYFRMTSQKASSET